VEAHGVEFRQSAPASRTGAGDLPTARPQIQRDASFATEIRDSAGHQSPLEVGKPAEKDVARSAVEHRVRVLRVSDVMTLDPFLPPAEMVIPLADRLRRSNDP
jgi:hypothetical protein